MKTALTSCPPVDFCVKCGAAKPSPSSRILVVNMQRKKSSLVCSFPSTTNQAPSQTRGHLRNNLSCEVRLSYIRIVLWLTCEYRLWPICPPSLDCRVKCVKPSTAAFCSVTGLSILCRHFCITTPGLTPATEPSKRPGPGRKPSTPHSYASIAKSGKRHSTSSIPTRG